MSTHRSNTKELVTAALLGVLIFIGGILVIPIGPVPITLQTLFVFIAALRLPKKYGVFSIVVFILLKLLFTGGFAAFLLPTFGYILAFLFVPFLVDGKQEKTPWARLILATILIYLLGTLYLFFIQNVINGIHPSLISILWAAVIPFIPFDLVKMFLAVQVNERLKKI